MGVAVTEIVTLGKRSGVARIGITDAGRAGMCRARNSDRRQPAGRRFVIRAGSKGDVPRDRRGHTK